MFPKELRESFSEAGINFAVYLGLKRRKFVPQQRLDGKVIVITGATRSIGKETAVICSALGAKVVIACRDHSLGHSVAKEITDAGQKPPLVVEMDLSSLESVAKAAKEINERTEKIDALINNAGVMTFSRTLTGDSIELMIQTNYVGHFLLTKALLPSLNKSNDPRVIFVSSLYHHKSGRKGFDLDDFFLQRNFDSFFTYSQSKLACLMFCRSLAKEQPNIHFYSVDPGMSGTDIVRNFPRILRLLHKYCLPKPILRTVHEAALTLTGPLFLPKNSYDRDHLYFGDSKPKDCSPSVFDEEMCERVYLMTEKLVSIYSTSPKAQSVTRSE